MQVFYNLSKHHTGGFNNPEMSGIITHWKVRGIKKEWWYGDSKNMVERVSNQESA